jgi:hypothetical protein
MGTSGQRSRTSNIIGILPILLAYAPGIAIVRGVLVARTTSPRSDAAFRDATNANVRKDLTLPKKDILLLYGTSAQCTMMPASLL